MKVQQIEYIGEIALDGICGQTYSIKQNSRGQCMYLVPMDEKKFFGFHALLFICINGNTLIFMFIIILQVNYFLHKNNIIFN